jgi:elongation factor Ts
MAVTAQMVKDLREMTGAGMMDCKNALVETDGDMERSIEILREKGLAKAAKKAGRIATEGLVRAAFSPDGKKAAIIEVNSETDFVAKNEEFVAFVDKLAELALDAKSPELADYLAMAYDETGSIAEVLNTKIARIGENMNIRRFQKFEEPGVVYAGYIHGNGSIGVIVGLATEASVDDIQVVGKDVAMQVASMSPKFLDESAVDSEYLQKEREIMTQLVLNEGKTGDMVTRIVDGKLKKEIKEVCLIEQKFVKNGDLTVCQYVEEAGKAMGKPMSVASFVRYEVGEGIEKKEEDFAAEVARQISAN